MSGLGEKAAPETQGESGVYPTEACEEVAIPGVDGLLCLIGAVIVRRAYLEVYSVSPGKTFQGLRAFVVNAECRGLEATV